MECQWCEIWTYYYLYHKYVENYRNSMAIYDLVWHCTYINSSPSRIPELAKKKQYCIWNIPWIIINHIYIYIYTVYYHLIYLSIYLSIYLPTWHEVAEHVDCEHHQHPPTINDERRVHRCSQSLDSRSSTNLIITFSSYHHWQRQNPAGKISSS